MAEGHAEMAFGEVRDVSVRSLSARSTGDHCANVNPPVPEPGCFKSTWDRFRGPFLHPSKGVGIVGQVQFLREAGEQHSLRRAVWGRAGSRKNRRVEYLATIAR